MPSSHQARPDEWAGFLAAAVPELLRSPHGSADAATSPTPAQPGALLKRQQAKAERAEIQRVLTECDGDRALASQRLGISRTTLWRKLKGRAE